MAGQLLGLVVMLSLLLLLPNTQPFCRIPRLNCLPMIMNNFLDANISFLGLDLVRQSLRMFSYVHCLPSEQIVRQRESVPVLK